jgi:hypothetical protein
MRLITVFFTVVSLAACATPRGIDPTGPYPDVRTGNVVREETEIGVLVVDTSRVKVDQEGRSYVPQNDSDWDSSHSVPTGYAIYDRSGRLMREVPNHSRIVVSDEGPTEVALPTGRYLVRLDRAEGGVQTFWVTIEARRRTEVDPARLVPGRSGEVGVTVPLSSVAAKTGTLPLVSVAGPGGGRLQHEEREFRGRADAHR